MSPEPLYRAADLRCAYQLRYGWTGWPSHSPFPMDVLARALPAIAPAWGKDGIRVLESSLSPTQIQLTPSTTPQVSPVMLAARVKGRIQHYCRQERSPVDFSRKVAVRSLGDPIRAEVEAYIQNQIANEPLADERFREMLAAFTVVDQDVDLSRPTESNSGRYWYNLHVVLVVRERYRMADPAALAKVRDTAVRICARKGYAASRVAVLPDHLHLALRGAIAQSPEDIALAFLNNLAYALDQRPWWEAGYYAGTYRGVRNGCYTAAGERQRGTLARRTASPAGTSRQGSGVWGRSSRLAAELLHLPEQAGRGRGLGKE